MTNYEKIKAMSIEEMAEFLENITSSCWELAKTFEAKESTKGICENCKLCEICFKSLTMIDGLESEAEDNG